MRLRQSPHSWVLFSFGLILLGVTLLVTELGSPQFTDDNWTRFLGRLHPVVLHLPIGLFAGLCILEIIRLRDNTPGLAFAARVVLFLTAVSAVFAASFGLLLAANDDYTGSTAFWHKSLGVAFAAGTLVLLLLREENHEEHSRIRKAAYYGSLLTLSLLIGFVGHLGGSLTHGANYLTEYAPSWFAQRENLRDLSADAPTDSNDVYRNQIEPIFQQYCVSCHGPEKQKSRYRLDTFKNLLVAGSSQETPIVPGKPNESYLVELLWLPEEDDMAMPPEGKIRPSPEEILIITHWVAQGAPGPIVDEIAKQAQQREQSARIAAIDYLTQQDIVVLPMGQDLPHYYVDFLNVDTQPNDAIWTNLTTIKNQVEVLKLSTIKVTPQQVYQLRGSAALKQLVLGKQSAVDEMVKTINSLPAIEELNLFGSDLSDQGLAQLDNKQIGKLYLGDTAVTQEGITSLQELQPDTEIIGSPDPSELDRILEQTRNDSTSFDPEKQ